MFLRKRLFFKVSQSSGQSICVGGFVSKVAGLLQPATLSKKWLQHRFFCVILQNFYNHNFSENLQGTASKGSSYFVFKHKVDLRHCKEIKHFHNTHKNVPLKTNYRFKIWKFQRDISRIPDSSHPCSDNLHWFDLVEAAVQWCF